jgi:uncharacterized protein (TIGR02391 family)
MAAAGVKTAAITNRMRAVQRKLQMTDGDALLVVAAQAGLNLASYGLEPDELTRLNQHLQALAGESPPQPSLKQAVESNASSAVTPATLFNSRNFHEIIVSRSRRAFTTGQHQDAVLRAFKSVNNRVKNLSGSFLDGQKLMARVFKHDDPLLDFSDQNNDSEVDEQKGMMLVFMGAMTGMRNPRAHEDHWSRDDDVLFVLEALSLASLLHRLLDVAEGRTGS